MADLSIEEKILPMVDKNSPQIIFFAKYLKIDGSIFYEVSHFVDTDNYKYDRTYNYQDYVYEYKTKENKYIRPSQVLVILDENKKVIAQCDKANTCIAGYVHTWGKDENGLEHSLFSPSPFSIDKDIKYNGETVKSQSMSDEEKDEIVNIFKRKTCRCLEESNQKLSMQRSILYNR